MVGRNVFAENSQTSVSVPFGDVTKYLVIRTVFFDDVENVLDGRLPTDARGNRAGARRGNRQPLFIRIRGIPEHLGRIAAQPRFIRDRHDGDRPDHQLPDVLRIGGPLLRRLRTFGVRKGAAPFAVGDVQGFAVGTHGQCRRIPAHGDKAQNLAFAASADINHGHVIVIGVRRIEMGPVSAHRQGIRRAPRRTVWIERHRYPLGNLLHFQINSRDRIAIGVCDKQPSSIGGKDHGVGMVVSPDAARHLHGRSFDGGDFRCPPKAHIDRPAVRGSNTGVGMVSYLHLSRAACPKSGRLRSDRCSNCWLHRAGCRQCRARSGRYWRSRVPTEIGAIAAILPLEKRKTQNRVAQTAACIDRIAVPLTPNPSQAMSTRARLTNLLRKKVDHIDGLNAIAVIGHEQMSAVRMQDQRQRQITDFDLLPRRRDRPAVRKEKSRLRRSTRQFAYSALLLKCMPR